jgi:signal transduction histidine kinase
VTPQRQRRSEEIFAELQDGVYRRTDRLFLWLMVAQWLFAIALALAISPFSWTGQHRALHVHVEAAIVLGGIISGLPIALVIARPGWWATRHVVAVAQMLWSAMFIMITGGRIETHFHIFGSLAFLAFYRDWKLMATATVVVAADHLIRGLLYPESVYGIANPEWWRFLEHAAWVTFEDIVLVLACVRQVAEMRTAARHAAELEATGTSLERQVRERTADLEDSIERYRALVERTAAIPFEWDMAARRTRYVAPQVAALLGVPPAEVGDQLLRTCTHPDDGARVIAFGEAFLAGSRTNTEFIDYRMLARTGETKYVRMFLSSGDGSVVRGILLDITGQKHLEMELQQAQKLESVGRLAAGIAHEINTPVQFVTDSVQFAREATTDVIAVVDRYRAAATAAIAGHPAVELAAEAAGADAQADLPYVFGELPRALDRALDGLDRVATIVRSMKQFAHPDTSEMTAVDLNAAIQSTLVIARNEYKYVADLALDLGELPAVVCHAGEINQAILNVVVNAAHAIAGVVGDTGARGTIAVTTRVDGDHAVVAIRDTGGGIPEAIRDRVFDPFFTTKDVGKGTGQGLAIVRSVIVDKHGGTVAFASEPGVGTTFELRVPIDRRVATATKAAKAATPAQAEAA